MKTLLLIFLLLNGLNAFAEKFTSTIHSIDLGNKAEFHMIRFDNGRVIFVRPEDKRTLETLQISNKNIETIEVDVNKKNYLVSARQIDEASSMDNYQEALRSEPVFEPSIVKSTNEALKIFNKMRKDYTKKGECYNRAHIWTYEEHQRSGLNSMKIFMFFTERYIRKYKFHWWFHVTPMVYVRNQNSPRTLDRRYTSGPRQTKTWSDVFVKSKKRCKKVEKFDDFWLNQKTQDCYHIHASMYYVIPRDLEKRDLTGIEKTEFKEKEIKRAYNNGFKQ